MILNLTPDDIVNNTEYYSKCEDVVGVSEIVTKGTYINFVPKALCLIKALTKGTVSCWEQTRMCANGDTYSYVNIGYSRSVSELFDPFRKLGVAPPCIRIGYRYDNGTEILYLSRKDLRDINKFGEDVRKSLCMYMLSISHLVNALSMNGVDKYFDDSMALAHIGALETFVKDCLMNLTELSGMNVELKEIPTGELSMFAYQRESHMRLAMLVTCDKKPVSYAYAHAYTSTKDYGACIVLNTMANNWYVISPDNITTSQELTYMDASEDSWISQLYEVQAHTRKTSVPFIVKHREKLLGDKFSYSLIDCADNLPDTVSSETVETFRKYEEYFESSCDIRPFDKTAFETFTGIKPVKTTAFSCDDIANEYASDAYAQELFKQKQAYYDDFDLGVLSNALKGFANGDIYTMMFTGSSGTGKSTAAKVIPSRCGIPFVCVNFSANIEECDLFGTMIPNPEKKCADDPEFVWRDGIITRAIRNGYCAILEEINFARPGVLGKLNSLLDESRQIDLGNGELLRAHKNFRMIATCNIAYEGTNRFNKALINRFDMCVNFEELPKPAFIAAVCSRTGYKDRAKVEKIYAVYEALKKFAKEQDVNAVVSIRQMLCLFKEGKYFKNAKDAVMQIIVNPAFIEDLEYLQEFKDTVLPSFDLSFKL